MMENKKLKEMILNGNIMIPTLLLETYKSMGLNEKSCMLLIQLHSFIIKGICFPSLEDLSHKMTLTRTECAQLLRQLIQQGYLAIEQNNDHHLYSESYSLDPLWEKMVSEYCKMETESNQQEEESLYTIFENEFGRPLSPIECETLTLWLEEDRHSIQLIKGALREAVISGKLNFRYIDRILFDWKKKGITTLQQAKAHGEKIRSHTKGYPRTVKEKENQVQQTFPLYNWLEK
ncbi:DnaD domain-containing protein [Terrilactibacillus laevilacticus]|uniref:DnaD domain-containing protein n=1 Tax=Terrilactibacillus laevilacticus TaxID=1380157 RepID=UPI00319E848E